ncbi:MAG TPA: hypothetical protein VGL13_09665 [Polyangiaceae bacterium]
MADLSNLLLLAEDASLLLADRIAAAHELATAGDPRVSSETRVRVAGGAFALGVPPRSVAAEPFSNLGFRCAADAGPRSSRELGA